MRQCDTDEAIYWKIEGDEIQPTSWPAVDSYLNDLGERCTLYYDPALTHVDSELTPPLNMLWRGMGDDEYRQAQQRGYFKSEGWRVNPNQRGKTYFTTACFAAVAYATEFAPWRFKPTFDKPAHVVGIPSVSSDPDDPNATSQQPISRRHCVSGLLKVRNWREVGFDEPVSVNEVRVHYVGHVAAIIPGRDGVSEPQITVVWVNG